MYKYKYFDILYDFTKLHQQIRYFFNLFRFDFAGLAQAIQPSTPTDTSPPYHPSDWMLGPTASYSSNTKTHLPPYASTSSQVNHPTFFSSSHAYWAGHPQTHPAHHPHPHHPGSMYSSLQTSVIGAPSGQLASHLSSCYG